MRNTDLIDTFTDSDVVQTKERVDLMHDAQKMKIHDEIEYLLAGFLGAPIRELCHIL